MKKRLMASLLAMMMAASFAGCGGSGAASSQAPSSSAPASAADGGSAPAEGGAAAGGEVKGLEAAIAEQPVLLTSVGQSADVDMVKVLLEKAEITPTMNKLATSADLGDNKTLVLAVGGSSKGLGAAGIDANQELERVKELVDAADAAGMTIIALHVGGEARRGDLSDKFVAPSFEKADYAIIVADGDKDGMMAGLASQKGIPMDVVASMGEATTPLKAAFK